MNLVFSTLQIDTGLAAAFRFEFPADQPEKLRAAKRGWFRPELDKVPAALFEAGLRRIGSEWQAGRQFKSMPSIGDFLELCQPSAEALGLPSAAAAYREACANAHPAAGQRWSHPAVHHAACETGFSELRNLPEAKSRALFDRAYAVTVRMLLAGEPLREIPKALPASVSVSTPEVGRSTLAALRARVRGVVV
ncbi:hypothetical protein SAMN05216201_11152 [Pseudomonas linyingensis]|uniref:Uncharacterized protein n=1 Tax=Pseudomonas linyingensis TaxID=915471 RepID=A0A1H7A0Q9_9PSED|nr:replication protein P [Pseudomonas linyingensis]SEJ57487.1 hypothetical protein SAMN05216201_11152 [Pseudomonas linyingensis]